MQAKAVKKFEAYLQEKWPNMILWENLARSSLLANSNKYLLVVAASSRVNRDRSFP